MDALPVFQGFSLTCVQIQCDSTDQSKPCNWCEHHSLACTFNRVRGRRKKRDLKARLVAHMANQHGLRG